MDMGVCYNGGVETFGRIARPAISVFLALLFTWVVVRYSCDAEYRKSIDRIEQEERPGPNPYMR
jgi:hypothetical protein